MRKRMRTTVLALALAAGLLAVVPTAVAATGDPAPTQTDRLTDRATDRARPAHPKRWFARWVVRNTAEFLDVTHGDVVSILARGGTLADLADENGSSGEDLAAALVAIAQSHADEAVASGRATQEQADAFMERVTAAIDDAVFDAHHPGRGHRDDGLRALLWRTTLEYLDATRGDIVSTFARGGTLADLAEAGGSSGEELVVVLVEVVAEKLDEKVADGTIDEAERDEILSRLAERIETFVFSTHEPGRR